MSDIELVETIDQGALNKLLGASVISYNGKIVPEEKLRYFKAYAKKVKNGKATVKYHKGKHGFGRKFADKGLQGLWKPLRHTLTHAIYYDVDIVNCHPTLYSQLCKKHNIMTPKLDYYINNREEVLKSIVDNVKCSRDEAKTLINIMLNLGSIQTWKDNKDFNTDAMPTFIGELTKELRENADTLELKDPFKVKSIIKKSRDPELKKNPTASLVSITLGEIEDQILDVIRFSFKSKGYSVEVLVFDGCMVLKNKDLPDSILREIEEEIKEKLGYSVRLLIKPQDCIIDLSQCIPVTDIKSDTDASKEFIRLYGKDHFVYVKSPDGEKGKTLIFDDETGLWTMDTPTFRRIALRYEEYLGKYANSVTKFNSMMVGLGSFCANEDWEKTTEKTSLKKLLFRNGWYDMETGEFHDKNEEGFNPKIVFFERINRDYRGKDENLYSLVEEVREKVFYNVFKTKEGADWFIHILARGLAGDIEMKRFIFGVGETNAGKGVITTALREALGGYFDEFSGESLFNNKNSGNDDAQKMRWAYLIRHKRIIISNEVRVDGNLDATAIKRLTGGGDIVKGRLHGGNETGFIPHFLPICLCNDVPKINSKETAIKERIRCASFGFRFMEESEITDPTTQKVADKSIKTKLSSDDWKDALVMLLLWYYGQYLDNPDTFKDPEEVQEAKALWVESGGFKETILEEFEITNNEDDYITCKELIEYCKTKKLGMTDTKIGMELNNLVKPELKGSKVKRIAGKPTGVRLGIRRYKADFLEGCQIQDTLNEL